MSRWLLPLLLITLSGCFPSSCSRTDSRALFPSDSLSREIAASVGADTLQHVWDASLADLVEHPRTVAYDAASGTVYVSDTGGNCVLQISENGEVIGPVTPTSFEHPYLAGFRGDTLFIYNAGSGRVNAVVGGSVETRVDLPELNRSPSLSYLVASDEGFFWKLVAEQDSSTILSLDFDGSVRQRHQLPGPDWRHAGLLRMWGDSLASLSGYRPVVDILTPDGSLDTLALRGFDSPMLARSRRFMLGDVNDAPLLSSSAAPAGPLLYLLNLRAGWIQIDGFDHDGVLQRRLSQPNPQPQRSFYPVDIAAHQREDGDVDFFVLLIQPEPRVIRYLARAHRDPAADEATL